EDGPMGHVLQHFETIYERRVARAAGLEPTQALETDLPSRIVVNRLERYFLAITMLLLTMMSTVQIGSIIQETATNDEPVHLAAGYLYDTTGDAGMERLPPPLLRALAALPLLRMPVKPISPESAWSAFLPLLWQSPVSADTILFRARLVVIS